MHHTTELILFYLYTSVRYVEGCIQLMFMSELVDPKLFVYI